MSCHGQKYKLTTFFKSDTKIALLILARTYNIDHVAEAKLHSG